MFLKLPRRSCCHAFNRFLELSGHFQHVLDALDIFSELQHVRANLTKELGKSCNFGQPGLQTKKLVLSEQDWEIQEQRIVQIPIRMAHKCVKTTKKRNFHLYRQHEVLKRLQKIKADQMIN